MFMSFLKNFIFLAFICCFKQVFCFQIDGGRVERQSTTPSSYRSLPISSLFKKCCLSQTGRYACITDPFLLKQVALDTLHYIEKITATPSASASSACIVNPNCFKNILALWATKRTLQFVIKTITEDEKTKKFRLKDPLFLKQHFDFFRWIADKKEAATHGIKLPVDGSIRLTQYGPIMIEACKQKDKKHPYALYALTAPLDIRLTKQQILAGALEGVAYKNICKPLAWVARNDLEDALMQGTAVAKFSDNTIKILKVNQHNRVCYNKEQKNRRNQQRYWFFKDLTQKNNNQTRVLMQKFQQRKGVVFAGDIYHVGLGKLIVLYCDNETTKRKEMRLGILADTGGAFENNLYQIDIFNGVYQNNSTQKAFSQTVPLYARAYVLCAKNQKGPIKKALQK